jgi:hypothetical protein
VKSQLIGPFNAINRKSQEWHIVSKSPNCVINPKQLDLLSKHQQLGLEEGHKSNHDFEKPRN